MSPVRALVVPALAMALSAASVVGLGSVGTLPAEQSLLPRPDHAGFAAVNGVRIWYGIYNPHGSRPVVLLHGGLGSSADWRNQIPALARRHKVIVIDSRGQGRSQREGRPISYDLMMDDVLAVLDRLKIAKAAFAGWSDGGIIGLDIAIHHPDRISRLFAYGANFNPDGLIPSTGPVPLSELRAQFASLVDERASVVRDVNEMWAVEPRFTAAELAGIRLPTMIADGEHEEAIKPEHTRELAALIPGARLAILPDAGHAGLIEHPAAFNSLLLGFLDGS